MTYSYEPSQIGEFGLHRMRFELGDCDVAEPEKAAYLSDEEISVVLESSSSWRRAKLRLIETLLRRFSYEVDTEVAQAKWALHQRVAEWKAEYNRLKSEVDVEEIAESSALKIGGKGRPPAFWIGQHDWRCPRVP